MKEQDDTMYEVTIGCNNCGKTATYSLLKGVLITQVIPEMKCKHCGCQGVLRTLDYYPKEGKDK